MGKRVTIKPGASYVPLPQAGNPNKPFNGGQTADLTDAEYAALPPSVTRFLQPNPTTIADPSRPSKDVKADNSPNIVTSASGTVALKSGMNVLTLVGNVTVSFPTTATTGSTLAVEAVFVQDGTGGRTLTLPASAKAAGADTTVLSTGAGKTDLVRWVTVDGGNTWLRTNKQLDIR